MGMRVSIVPDLTAVSTKSCVVIYIFIVRYQYEYYLYYFIDQILNMMEVMEYLTAECVCSGRVAYLQFI